MAKDSDIDVYVAIPLYEYAYISGGHYIDLSQFDILNERFESNDFARCAASHNGTYVGVPITSYSYDSSTNTQADTPTKYLIKNVHALDGKFDDPSGEELAAVLKHFRDDPSDSRENAIYEDDITMIGCYYLMMSPGCEKQDEAADFLAFVFDYTAGNIDVEHSLGTYPQLDSYEDVHLSVDYDFWAIIEPIRTAYNEIIGSETPLSDSKIEKLAYDAARQTLMRLQG